ncbi:hypothetical protein RKD23_004324 [Streptomyces sp. SAI-170]|uniref:DUF4232 domain-containing protein n=1 Tax=Streptomyces sp. SAI-170 TaxID=3377729 RepID=UPI003C7A8993
MRRPLISVAAAVLLAGAAGCSSSSSGPGDDSAGRPVGTPSGAASAGTASTRTLSPGTVSADVSRTGGGSSAPGASGETPTASSTPPPGVLYGTEQLPTPAADHCRTAHLTASARSTGSGRALVVLTHKGPGDCTLRGFPSLLFVGEAGRTELPVDWAGAAEDAAEVALSPGESATAELTFTSLAECEPITRLDVVPPGESRPLSPAFAGPVRICDTGVRVTAFAPAG